MIAMTLELDRIDRRILNVIQQDARISNADLAREVDLSPSPCWRRLKALQEAGVIRQHVSLLDADAVGLPVSVFVSVSLDKQIEDNLARFEAAVRERPEVMECYLMTGEADYLLRVVVPDLRAYERLVLEQLTRIPGVANIKSSFALKQVSYKTALPLEHL